MHFIRMNILHKFVWLECTERPLTPYQPPELNGKIRTTNIEEYETVTQTPY